ncbi:SRPBCC domain-containing protein [Paenibacillus sp. CC-CFT747]|nr:SRPBCC domain-containing protein [Paenibacillus sp. CC-CFT747]
MGKESLDPKAVTKEIYIECSRETLFPFFLEPQKMAQWMGNQILLEPRIGGALRIDFNGTDMVSGHYREVEPPGRIVFSWGWIGSATCPPGSSTVEIVLLEQGKGHGLS